MIVKDLMGQRFGRLVVIEKLPSKEGKCWWKCKCDCGGFKDVPTAYLTSGSTQSCGCLAKETRRKYGKINCKKASESHTSHRLSNTKEYFVWKNMIQRTSNPKNNNYHNYGGRGIKVCEEWKNLENFYKWCCESGYKEELEIDRIDVNGNYEPSNCRWITKKQQLNNKRDNVRVEINGVTHTLTEWSEITGINVSTLQYRYYGGDRGERLIRKVNLESYDTNRKAVSNTGITGISKRKDGRFLVNVTYKKKRYQASTKTLEEAIKKKEEILNSIKNKEDD